MEKVVTFGEIILRLSTNSGERIAQTNLLNMQYGGAEANVSISLSHFGHHVYLLSKVPENPLSDGALNHLKSYGVRTEYVLKGGERLGTYYMETGVGERSAEVTYDRKHSSINELTLSEINFDEIFRGATLYHLSGITPALSENIKEITLESLKKAKEHDVIISFDFNYRSKLWSRQEAAETIKTLLPYVDMCSCGELDAVHILGIKEANKTWDQTKRLTYYYDEMSRLYPNIKYMSSTFRTVMSASANRLQGNLYVDGIMYQSKEHLIDPIVDRVGGGDAFASGILHGILTEMEPQETISFATAASALKHTIHGDCNPFSVNEIKAFCGNGSGNIIR